MDERIIAISGAILAAIITSLFAPSVLYAFKNKYQSKKEAFDLAVRALARYYAEALDPGLQKNKVVYKGINRKVEMTPNTSGLLVKARSYVKANFTKSAYDELEKAIITEISIDNIPNVDFEKQRDIAVEKMAKELNRDICIYILKVVVMVSLVIFIFFLGYQLGRPSAEGIVINH
jgi:hypothetical protein